MRGSSQTAADALLCGLLAHHVFTLLELTDLQSVHRTCKAFASAVNSAGTRLLTSAARCG